MTRVSATRVRRHTVPVRFVDRLAGPVRGYSGSPDRPSTRGERWTNPLSFSFNIPVEMTEAAYSGYVGARVSRREALTVPAVKRVRDLICGTTGVLPVDRLDAGYRVTPCELFSQPEIDVPRSVTMTRLAEDLLFDEIGWWRITESDANGYPAHVVRLEPNSVNVRKNGRVYYSPDGTAQGMSEEWIPDAQLIRFDSPNPGLLSCGGPTIRDALNLARTVAKSTRDGMPIGFLSPTDDADTDEMDVDTILEDFRDAVARGAWPFLDKIKANILSWSPEQLQLASARDAIVLEIARLGGVDPEELGVSTTSRTYANSEQRRLDLIDFTLAAYIVAIEGRLSMNDVSPPGYTARFAYEGFLRSDTESRMKTYETGSKLGIYTPERIARIERIPTPKPPKPPAPPAPVAPPVAESGQEDKPVTNSAQFADPEPIGETFAFEVPAEAPQFKVDATKRTIFGTVIPWDKVARSGGNLWSFAPGSLHWSAPARVKLDKDHGYGTEFGRADTLATGPVGLFGTFKVGRGAVGEKNLMLAEDGVYDGLSATVTFEGEGDGWIPHPDNPDVRYVQSGTLRKVALTAMPAFDDARLTHVAASLRGDLPMKCTTCGQEHAPGVACSTGTPPTTAPAFDAEAFAASLTAGRAGQCVLGGSEEFPRSL